MADSASDAPTPPPAPVRVALPPLVPDPDAGAAPHGFVTAREAMEVLALAGLIRSPLRAGLRVRCPESEDEYVVTHRVGTAWHGVRVEWRGRDCPAMGTTKIPDGWTLVIDDASTRGVLLALVNEALRAAPPEIRGFVADGFLHGAINIDARALSAIRFLRSTANVLR